MPAIRVIGKFRTASAAPLRALSRQPRAVAASALQSGLLRIAAVRAYVEEPCPVGAFGHLGLVATSLFSWRENAIAKEPGSGYPEGWSWGSWLGASLVAQTLSSLPRLQP